MSELGRSRRVRALVWAVAAVLGLATGCSLLAKKTPTPAAQIDANELAHRTPPPNERYYVLLFGSHDALHQIRYSHTWATLIRATDIPGQRQAVLDVQTISWYPATREIRPWSFQIEPGTNLGLHETIRLMHATDQQVYMWGPYEVWHGLAHRFQVQKAFLESGSVGYQCVDTVGEAARTGGACDCIHALSDMDPDYPRWRYPLAFYGAPATENLVRRMMHSPGTVLGCGQTHDWLLEPLGLCDASLHRRTYHGRIVPRRSIPPS